MDSIWTNGSWQVVTTSNYFLFHYFILSISLSLVLSDSSNGTQFISLSSIIDKVQRKGGPLIKNRFQTTMLADGGPPLFFSLMKPASLLLLTQIKRTKNEDYLGVCLFVQKKDVGGIMTGVSVRKVLTMFVQIKQHSSFFFFNLRSLLPGPMNGTRQQRWWNEEEWTGGVGGRTDELLTCVWLTTLLTWGSFS